MLTALAALVVVLGIAACGSSGTDTSPDSAGVTVGSGNKGGSIPFNPENRKITLTIGSKSVPEQEILGEIYAQALTAAGYKVRTALNLGSGTVAWKAVKSGQISGYPEQVSTALTSFFGMEPEEVPSSARRAWFEVNEKFLEEDLQAFQPIPAGNVVFVHQRKTAWEAGYGLEATIEQVQKGLTRKAMQALDAQVELGRETPKQAAAAYLESAGYIG